MGGILGTSASERERKCDRAKRFRDGDGDKASMTSFAEPDSRAAGVVVPVISVVGTGAPVPPVPPVPSEPPGCLVAPASAPVSPIGACVCPPCVCCMLCICVCFVTPCSSPRLKPRDIDSTGPGRDTSDGILDVSMAGMSIFPPRTVQMTIVVQMQRVVHTFKTRK